MLATRMRMASGSAGYALFGDDPASLDGVDFFHGTPEIGMIVFKTAGTYSITPSEAGNVEVLVVAGGGATFDVNAGSAYTSGAGGGGIEYDDTYTITEDEAITVKVGAGGVRSSSATVTAGGGSQFGILTPGGGLKTTDTTGAASGSPQSNAGGARNTTGGGSGGGAGEAGSAGPGTTSGANGAAGLEYFGFGYGGAGAGGGYNAAPGGVGQDGGGNGASNGNVGTAPIPNSGGGGGGAGPTAAKSCLGSSGAKGIVIVRWGGYSKNYNATTNAVT